MLLEHRASPTDFTRSRTLTIEHTVGLIMSMVLARNANGYDISSQNYFRDLSVEMKEQIIPVRHQSVSEARAKLRWQAFEALLDEANLERTGLSKEFKFKGHIVRAIDGTSFFTPRTEDLLAHFSVRSTRAGETHYPYGLCVAAVNVFTGQPVAAIVGDYKSSERELLRELLPSFAPGDLSLLDRGLGGAEIYFEYDEQGQLFLHRTKTTGDRIASYIQKFLASGKKQKKIRLTLKDKSSGKERSMKIRLILGPIDSEGKSIVFVTNLVDKDRYPRADIIELYQKRWTCETLYGRVKNLLNLEKFHAQSHNGVMQEIFANLLCLSLAAAAVAAVVVEDKMDPEVEQPSFKNAAEVVRRNLFSIIDRKIRNQKPNEIVRKILNEVRAVKYKVRPGRSHPRVSRQPIKSWNLKKSAKLRAFEERKFA